MAKMDYDKMRRNDVHREVKREYDFNKYMNRGFPIRRSKPKKPAPKRRIPVGYVDPKDKFAKEWD